jgi:succinyl-diaminopimelate desuccinylase
MTSAANPIELTRELVRCPSVTPNEGGALDLLERVLKPAGFTCHRMTMREPGTPDVENLYARIGTTGPNLCFAGHTDVVPPGDEAAWTHPPFSAAISGDMLYGRGVADMKGAVACFIVAAQRYLASHGRKPKGSISLLITGDEEGPSINGTAKVLDWLKTRGEKLDACVVGEPTSMSALGDEIKIGRRGSVNGDLVVHGRQGHSAYPHLADNPVPKLARIIDRLSQHRLDDGSADFEPSSIQVTIISVPNTVANIIPSEARAKLNVRYNNQWTRPRIEARLREISDAAAAELGARYELTFSGTGDVFLTRPGPLVATLASAVEAETGRKPRLTTGGGTSDARFIQAVCPVVELGLINATIHHVDERASIADIEGLARIYERFIAGYFGSVPA